MGNKINYINWDQVENPAREWEEQKAGEIRQMSVNADATRAKRNEKKAKLVSKASRIKGAPYDTERIMKLQQQLNDLDMGFNLDVDGLWGKKTQEALDQAQEYGYKYNNGRLEVYRDLTPAIDHDIIDPIKKAAGKVKDVITYPAELVAAPFIKVKDSTAPYVKKGVNAIERAMDPITQRFTDYTPTKDDPVQIIPLNQNDASLIYSHGAGAADAAAAAAYHAIAPEGWSMPHSDALLNQIAAEIAYTEGQGQSTREKDPHRVPGQTYIGYATHGLLSGQNGNVNYQGTNGNATAKIMGGYRYVVNPDGSVTIDDPFAFNVTRDFSRQNGDQPHVYRNGEKDPYKNRQWSGLANDVVDLLSGGFGGGGIGTTTQNLSENFFTRQGKKRDNSITFKPGEINARNRIRLEKLNSLYNNQD